MSFTPGSTNSRIQVGSAVTDLDDKVGSFIVFVWPDDSKGPSGTFAVSKNDIFVDWKRLSCVKDANGAYIVPSVNGLQLIVGLNDPTIRDYATFNVKILG